MRSTDGGTKAIREEGLQTRLAPHLDELERFFDEAWREFGFRRLPLPWKLQRDLATWAPNVDAFERDGILVVRADLPGVKREDVQVTVEGDTLHVHGERKEEREIKEDSYYRCEREVGEFSRTIPLPEDVDPQAVEAVFRDGVLEVTVPLPKTRSARTIPVAVK